MTAAQAQKLRNASRTTGSRLEASVDRTRDVIASCKGDVTNMSTINYGESEASKMNTDAHVRGRTFHKYFGTIP